MALNGLTDVCATVTVPKSEYERLLRESEKLRAISRCSLCSETCNIDTIKTILDLKEEVEE